MFSWLRKKRIDQVIENVKKYVTINYAQKHIGLSNDSSSNDKKDSDFRYCLRSSELDSSSKSDEQYSHSKQDKDTYATIISQAISYRELS